jgi:hypothetical protein
MKKKLQGQGVFFMKKTEEGTAAGNRLPRACPKQAGGFYPD